MKKYKFMSYVEGVFTFERGKIFIRAYGDFNDHVKSIIKNNEEMTMAQIEKEFNSEFSE